MKILLLLVISSFGIGPATSSDGCGRNCRYCYKHVCTECNSGFCGDDCENNCIGECLDSCNMNTCICKLCTGGYYAENCSVPCSNNCLSPGEQTRTCDRYTGECKDGCVEGYCSQSNGCKIECGENCVNKSCDFDCFCTEGCVDGFYDNKCEKACPQDHCLKCSQAEGTCTKWSPKKHNETDWVPNCEQCCKLNCNCSQTKEEYPQGENKTMLHVVSPVRAFFVGSGLMFAILGALYGLKWWASDARPMCKRDLRCMCSLFLCIIAMGSYIGMIVFLSGHNN